MRFLLDTVTISEFRKGSGCAPAVLRWQASLTDDMFGLSVVSLAEIRYGIRRVARKDPPFADRLQAWYDLILVQREMFYVFTVDREVAAHSPSHSLATRRTARRSVPAWGSRWRYFE